LSVATAWAVSLGAEAVTYAAHGGDHAIYPDCREEFAGALDKAIRLCDWSEVRLYRPFVNSDKAQIAAMGDRLGAKLERTWSCYKGGEFHCGRCGTCVERREAFHLAGVEDLTVYDSSAPTVEELVASGWKL
ncbi:MAG: 7-cyano-7-deazaguanine synthase, partial [Cyanothece sp. SIO2G6]|nr:7-cyano-7-deazaguanine synthase [Cyanothece sp. SIO2G6]